MQFKSHSTDAVDTIVLQNQGGRSQAAELCRYRNEQHPVYEKEVHQAPKHQAQSVSSIEKERSWK
jgi:hypothetical protein